MLSSLALFLLAPLLFYAFSYVRAVRQNIAAARQIGLRYIVLPVFLLDRKWVLSAQFIYPLLARLPRSWTEPALLLLRPEWTWHARYEPFQRLGSDTFLTISSRSPMLWTSSPEVITQIFARRNDFIKPVRFYKLLSIYGRNILTTEGAPWRVHRKITSAPFTEQNNELVWAESIQQTRSMLRLWLGAEDEDEGAVDEAAEDTMRLALNVVGGAAFGKTIAWPGQSSRALNGAGGHSCDHRHQDKIPPGHQMSYKDALETVLANIVLILILPNFLLRNAPFRRLRRAALSFHEWHRYMWEMFRERKKEVELGQSQKGFDLIGAMIRGSIDSTKSSSDHSSPSADKGQPQPSEQTLSDDEILGNAFLFIIAGHETTANTLHFALVFLAMNPWSQKRLQADLDNLLGDRPVYDWSYERDMSRLLNGMAGAVMNETLRLVPPVVSIIKIVTSTPQQIVIEGQNVVLPAGLILNLHTVAAHRHPKYWPTPDGTFVMSDHVHQFRPERWLIGPSSPLASNPTPSVDDLNGKRSAEPNGYDDQDHQSPTTTLYHPPRGAFFPFSDGARACLGRRFAQVEVLAALAFIFRTYSIELAVSDNDDHDHDHSNNSTAAAVNARADDNTNEENLLKQKRGKRDKWDEARGRAEWLTTEGMSSIITLQMRKGKVPLRIVKRGRERYWYDS